MKKNSSHVSPEEDRLRKNCATCCQIQVPFLKYVLAPKKEDLQLRAPQNHGVVGGRKTNIHWPGVTLLQKHLLVIFFHCSHAKHLFGWVNCGVIIPPYLFRAALSHAKHFVC
jgi:hypothetical protein